jgi:hypothetical protein
MKTKIILLLILFCFSTLLPQNSKRWNLNKDQSISWNINKASAHEDHIEMSGLQISSVIHYGINDNGEYAIQRRLVFPLLRTIPNDTHASLIIDFNGNDDAPLIVDGKKLQEYPVSFNLRGILTVKSRTNTNLFVERKIFPSPDKPALVEIVKITNTGNTPGSINIKNNSKPVETDSSKGVYGKYIIQMDINKTGSFIIPPGDNLIIHIIYSGRKAFENTYAYSADYELNKREGFINSVFNNLILETPNDTINREFAFAKIRTTESIYDTKGGLMHGPGGESYYAAIWANDQAEYANPFFPFLGNINGNESALNSFRHFARFINPEYKPIPSSIIAEGTDIWNGVGDRGDQAMIAYGASRFALESGNIETGKELWPLIKWCLEYLELKKTPAGVIASDTDELEHRFSCGKINLSTNSLTYGAYISAAYLADELNEKNLAASYRHKATELRNAIEKYFGAKVQGFNTYRYHEGNDKLRAWICMPLVMGIAERKDETINALLSDYLWTTNGILTESGSTTFWDRSTLYAFRGLFACGATNRCMSYFNYYSAARLLGEHVPYPVEAWPEGNQRHLAAESALYCRTVTEGLFGFTPTGLKKFTVSPWLPDGWNYMKLKNIRAFGSCFDLEVQRNGKNETITVILQNGQKTVKSWDKKSPVSFTLP